MSVVRRLRRRNTGKPADVHRGPGAQPKSAPKAVQGAFFTLGALPMRGRPRPVCSWAGRGLHFRWVLPYHSGMTDDDRQPPESSTKMPSASERLKLPENCTVVSAEAGTVFGFVGAEAFRPTRLKPPDGSTNVKSENSDGRETPT